MLENLRRKSLVKTYIDPIYSINFEQGYAVYLNSYHIEQYKQRLSKKKVDEPFSSTFDGVSKGFRVLTNTLGNVQFNMIYCPKGTFTMGHKDQKDNKPRQETIERPFLLGETEVTQELYTKVMGENPSKFQNSPQNPVERVSWYDAILFCNELSKLQGLEKCYVLTDVSRIDADGKDQKRIMSAKVTCDFNKNGYRLPTEKEWEYAAKASTENEWAGTNNKADLKKYVVYAKNCKIGDNGQSHPVKSKLPNEWGFYDMSGNVKEWCWDKYYPDEHKLDISAPRVFRGGCFCDDAGGMHSAFRVSHLPDNRVYDIGFRVCRSIVN